jgi:MOSC domain-containing protein YiiM
MLRLRAGRALSHFPHETDSVSAFEIPAEPCVVAVCISPGGIPKLPQPAAQASQDGLIGDGRNHAKHIRPDRAISLFDWEILQDLVGEGFPLVPGAAGENLTVQGLHVQNLPPGTLLQIGDVVLKLEKPRQPCYVLDAINPRLKDAILGRCGYLASVIQAGALSPQMAIGICDPDKAHPLSTTSSGFAD